ncbi:MAG TPA: LPS-assembly protein LptD [Burkholderiales bacterium]|nr:LPS-assembly protein LptD [Burkholderiales bacterium]
MSFIPARFSALAIALLCSASAWSQGQGLQLPRQQRVKPDPNAPITLEADRIEGVTGKGTSAQGNATLRRGDLSIRADSLSYSEESDEVEAKGDVRLERGADRLRGPNLRYSLKDATGMIEKPEFSLAPRPRGNQAPVAARGQAESVEFLGEDRYRVRNGRFTSCKPGDDGWYVRANELDLDFTRQVGTAHGGSVYFEGVPVIYAPSISFSLNNERKSGFLPLQTTISGKSGIEVGVPYYLNLAPNYDATLTPRYLQKRGTQLVEQARYMEKNYIAQLDAEQLPNDRTLDEGRSLISFIGSYNRDSKLLGNLNLNKVSDDNYFRDLSTRINLTSQTTLPREGSVTYNGTWWGSGSYSTTARVQTFQVLQDPEAPITAPYGRTPQLTLTTLRQDIGGFDFRSAEEFVYFSHPTLVTAKRTSIFPSLSLPVIAPQYFITPRVAYSAAYYSLDQNTAPATTTRPGPSPANGGEPVPRTIGRALPIYSLDSGLIYEKETQAFGQTVTQTLEPRLFYVYIPFRDQRQIPLFDTAIADFNYAQIFSENMFSGNDRINDANQLTAAVTSRLLLPSSGQEVMRGTFGQRYYFKDQQVTLNPTDTPRTYNASNLLAALSGRLSSAWSIDAGTEYDQRDFRTERLTLAARYRPEGLRTLNLSYRYLSGDITQTGPTKQIDVSAQWPLFGRWYGVGRFNYSLQDSKIIETIGGFEYAAGCWTTRIVLQKFALTAGTTSSSLFFQLELNGFSRLGSNPLEALRRNVPGYQRINAPSADGKPDEPFDLYN